MASHKALVLNAFSEPVALKPVSTPEAQPGSAIVKVLYAPLQPYARAIFTGKIPFPITLPQTLGNAGVGRIESVGPDATTLKPGQLVWIDSVISARDDPDTQILLGLYGGATPASKKLMSDVWRNGLYAEKARVPLENVFPLDEEKLIGSAGLGYQLKDFANLTNFLVAFGGLDWAGVGPGSTVVVAPATGKFSGGGVAVALGLGAKVIAVSRNIEAMQALKALPGAGERLSLVQSVGDVQKDREAISKAVGTKGAHVYLDLSPAAAGANGTPAYLTAGLSSLRRNGIALFMGYIHNNVEVSYVQLLGKNSTIRGQFMYERKQVERFITMVENGNLRVDVMKVVGEFELEEIEEALDYTAKHEAWGTAVVLAPNGKQTT